MSERILTCIVCPKGCEIHVSLDQNNNITAICGNSCPRGAEYAKAECTCPVRTLTGTVAVEGGGVVPYRTTKAIPKKDVFALAERLNHMCVSADTKQGAVILADPLGDGADVITTASAEYNR